MGCPVKIRAATWRMWMLFRWVVKTFLLTSTRLSRAIASLTQYFVLSSRRTESASGNGGKPDETPMKGSNSLPEGRSETTRSEESNNFKGKQPEGSVTSQECDEGDGAYDSPNSTPPPRVDEIDRWQYHIGLQEWGSRSPRSSASSFSQCRKFTISTCISADAQVAR